MKRFVIVLRLMLGTLLSPLVAGNLDKREQGTYQEEAGARRRARFSSSPAVESSCTAG